MSRRKSTRTPKQTSRRRAVIVAAGLCAAVILSVSAVLAANARPQSQEAPEAGKVLAVQANMPFQILIPAYLPPAFNRAGAAVSVNQSGPGNEAMVEISYRTDKGEALFVREWVPVNPDLEILAKSRPIQTRWGKGWLLAPQGGDLLALWVDVGPLRISTYSHYVKTVSQEQLLQIGESMGPASNRVVFSFSVEKPVIREVAPPPPVEAKTNEQGVQELALVITPGGYSPLRFMVRKGAPVRLTFRSLGQVGCGNTLIMPTAGGGNRTVQLTSPNDKRVIEFTPQQAGEFVFNCAENMFRGIMVVQE